jgi:hypothetical protein
MITDRDSHDLRTRIHTPSPTPAHHHDGCQCDTCVEIGSRRLIQALRESLRMAQRPSATVIPFPARVRSEGPGVVAGGGR